MENGTMMKLKLLSNIANDILHRCAEKLDTSVDVLVDEFEAVWKPEQGHYARKLMEYCCAKALRQLCCQIEEFFSDGLYNRFTFDMMLAWQTPSSDDEESDMEGVAKEREDRKPVKVAQEHEDIPLFYSDIMPLLVDHGPGVEEDAFVWLASLVPLAGDVVNGRFSFETLTTSTANRFHFPAYDRFLEEIDQCIKHLQKQATPKGVELADDEFILHVEGTATSQRVVRHIGGTSWPGRLTLTNYALYFEASGILSYEDALKINLAQNSNQSVKPTATGPLGAPLFDKAMIYQSSEWPEGIVLEFPELTSSTRRDHWLSLTKEIILLHQFLKYHEVFTSIQAWEMHARTILAIIRLHAAREMFRMAPPVPKNLLIFTLFDELPKGDYLSEELARSLKQVDSGHLCSASSILRRLNMPRDIVVKTDLKDVENQSDKENLKSLDSAVNEAKEQAKEIEIAKATTESLKEEGISDSILILLELLKPLRKYLIWLVEVLTWERPSTTVTVIAAILLIAYKEWFGKALAACLLWAAIEMLRARHRNIKDKYDKVVICTASDQTATESIVLAHQGLRAVHEIVQTANITILKILSILTWRAEKHARLVMMVMIGLAMVPAMVPLKFLIIGGTLCMLAMTSKLGKVGTSERGNRRVKEWWDSIPVVRVENVDCRPH
ncbi:hypothetical protein Nepgr_028403 [Nepenthes gracilis]|uniref:Uncharacterized protein n=1 Tax=Nepenthes gracilis TaxID=150966 RepID=A0AAD3TBM0_NEPGR|nr:hypothetical protein Nepgr_028403 [Nepenthes gracilis]